MLDRIRNLCVLIALSMIFSTGSALACSMPPAQAYLPTDELIAASDHIGLVRAKSVRQIRVESGICDLIGIANCGLDQRLEDMRAAGENRRRGWSEVALRTVSDGYLLIEVEFEVIETISGNPFDDYVEHFLVSRSEWTESNFDDHNWDGFWSPRSLAGRGAQRPDCQIYFSFTQGETYLAFPEANGHVRSYEIVRSPDDRWLTYIREQVNND